MRLVLFMHVMGSLHLQTTASLESRVSLSIVEWCPRYADIIVEFSLLLSEVLITEDTKFAQRG